MHKRQEWVTHGNRATECSILEDRVGTQLCKQEWVTHGNRATEVVVLFVLFGSEVKFVTNILI
jgi:hypothetical protein